MDIFDRQGDVRFAKGVDQYKDKEVIPDGNNELASQE